MASRKRTKVEPESDGLGSEDRIIASYREKINSPLSGIRSHCVECMGGSVQLVSGCVSENCSLHPFRMGKNTMHSRYGKVNPHAPKNKKKNG